MTATIAPPSLGRTLLNKVPEVTIFFWMIKILATTVGETAADFLPARRTSRTPSGVSD
nr:hypothetical protein [Solirubrobacter soli]